MDFLPCLHYLAKYGLHQEQCIQMVPRKHIQCIRRDPSSTICYHLCQIAFQVVCMVQGWTIVALGRVPRLIVGYMEQLQSGSKSPTELLMTIDEHMHIPPPPLIVMGEDTVLVEKQHHGYSFKWPTTSNRVDMPTRRRNNALVTIDRIWQLNDAGFLIQRSTPTTPQQLKDVCLSFSLFKLLRCRYARYTISEAGFIEARNFLWHMLLEDCDGERVLMVMVHELSFLHDYYYSSFPMSYSKTWLPVMSVFISLLSMSYCLLLAAVMCLGIFLFSYSSQLTCKVQCWNSDDVFLAQTEIVQIGNALYDYVQLVLLVALVMLTEVREIASYICSNWTKVALICRYMNDTSWQQSSNIQRRIGRVLQCRCTLLKHWEGKMSQCSILVLRPGRTPLALLRRLIHLPEENKLVPRAVKAAVLHALRSYDEGSRSGGVAPLPSSLRGRGGGNLIWEFSGTKGTAHTMLVCHIATSILEVRMGTQHLPDDHHIAATHLSRYCAYLVAHSPELLPDDDGWCKSLYKAVKKDADRVRVSSIPVSTPQVEYQQLVELLGTRSKHEILKNGLELGKRLADLAAAEEAAEAWRVLAGFWSEMILYVAPSENLDGHAEAIARGGEFITLLWALLAHLGIVRRADHTTTTAAAAGGGPAVV
uniref:Uncharacterized protein n=2 Tax=Avena sativa TaxID=4498 RepID=A0ACD6AAJ2_AVESA